MLNNALYKLREIILKDLLYNYTDINDTDIIVTTVLHYACINYLKSIISEVLADSKVNINCYNN